MVDKTKLNGKTVTITGRASGHGFTIGTKVLLNSWNGSTYIANGNSLAFSIKPCDFVYIYNKETIEEDLNRIKEEKVELQKREDYYNSALKFIEENKVEEFDEMQYKAYQVLKTVNSESSDLEKSKLISDILNLS
jgi:hypothetical protein